MNADLANSADLGGGVSCMECGARFDTVAESMEHPHMSSAEGATPAEVLRFEKVWQAEQEVKLAQASEFFNVGRARLSNNPAKLADRTAKAKASLFALVDAMTPELASAYGTWRAALLAEIAAAR